MLKRTILLFGFLFLMIHFSQLQAGGPETTGLAFLKVGAGARSVGMGEAYSAVATDASAAYWNPAGLAAQGRSEFVFTHNKWLQEINNEFAAVSFHIKSHAFGISVMTQNIGGIERRTGPTEEPLGDFNAHNVMAGISYARYLSHNFAVGITAKFLYEKIYVEESSGAAVDIGVRYQTNVPGLTTALVLHNFGFVSELENESSKLPRMVRVGAAYLLPREILQGKITLATDVVQVFEGTSHFNLGAEYLLKNMLAFRLGYQSGYADKDIHVGVGFYFGRYRLNYAFVPFSSDLGNSHRISVVIQL
ncbi:MAG: UPF0164 family protein [Calditrichaeota bacterium]|nr:UPF0164 family protein [Calditrichota bacterium]